MHVVINLSELTWLATDKDCCYKIVNSFWMKLSDIPVFFHHYPQWLNNIQSNYLERLSARGQPMWGSWTWEGFCAFRLPKVGSRFQYWFGGEILMVNCHDFTCIINLKLNIGIHMIYTFRKKYIQVNYTCIFRVLTNAGQRTPSPTNVWAPKSSSGRIFPIL